MHSKIHWEKIYETKQPHEVSWTQERPDVSLEFIEAQKLPKDARIIDVGGGDSKLVDFLLAEGYSNITVLDISEAAIKRAQQRLGESAKKVKWIVGDILDASFSDKYDLWHDRAAFHFQTTPDQIEKYLSIMQNALNGVVVLGTFSVDGPKKCSGLEIKQYDEQTMEDLMALHYFKKQSCKRHDHITPSGAVQNFIFCSYVKA